MLKYLPKLGNNVSYWIVFVFGLLTSFHCVGMCGGIMLTQTVKEAGLKKYSLVIPTSLYNLGRLFSYTLIGGIVGGLGQIINLSGIFKSIIPIIGGVFMIIMAINLLNIFPQLRKFNVMMPSFVAKKIIGSSGNNYSPLVIGFLSALMPCGPLQMVQLYALGTGSVFYGASVLFIFSIGTMPVLFLFGLINTLINKNHSKIILKASAVFVLILGFVMVNRGLALSGINFDIMAFVKSKNIEKTQNVSKIKDGYQVVNTSIKSDSFPVITIQKGIPVKWNLHADKNKLNDCNREIVIPSLMIGKKLNEGDNFIEFTPKETGNIDYTCWMGMIKSKIIVLDDLSEVTSKLKNNTNFAVKTKNTKEYGYVRKEAQKQTQNQETNNNSEKGENEGLKNWFQSELALDGQNGKVNKKIQTWNGWIFDRDCIGINPYCHTKDCNLMDTCYESGLGIITYIPNKEYNSYKSLDCYLNFDEESKILTKRFLGKLPKSWKSDITVKITGYEVEKIPVNIDETNVPENNKTKVDHYIKGVHINKIKAAYIDGVSINKLPIPNLVMENP